MKKVLASLEDEVKWTLDTINHQKRRIAQLEEMIEKSKVDQAELEDKMSQLKNAMEILRSSIPPSA